MVYELYGEYGLTLDNFSQDIYNMVKNTPTSSLHATIIFKEIGIMHEEVCSERPLNAVLEDLTSVLSEVSSKITNIKIYNTRLVGLQFEEYDTLTLIYKEI